MKNIIVIPVYKSELNILEITSFRQCLKVLSKHPISIIAPNNLDVGFYDAFANNLGVILKKEYFNPCYFTSINQYNKLLLSLSFYDRFKAYDYILLYQLDAFVFRDDLEIWANKGYDFIGAPLINNYYGTDSYDTMIVGNGGFSLRKIEAFINAYNFRGNLLKAKELIRRYKIFTWNKLYKRIPLFFLKLCGYQNKFNYYVANWKYNEDNFWTLFLNNTSLKLHLPPNKIAIQFSFEKYPSKLFELNNKKLPFGCHAWEKYEYDSFWKKYIQLAK